MNSEAEALLSSRIPSSNSTVIIYLMWYSPIALDPYFTGYSKTSGDVPRSQSAPVDALASVILP